MLSFFPSLELECPSTPRFELRVLMPGSSRHTQKKAHNLTHANPRPYIKKAWPGRKGAYCAPAIGPRRFDF